VWLLATVALPAVLLATPAQSVELPPLVGPPNVPPVVAHLNVSPSQGPVGTMTTWSGLCGYPASQIYLSLSREEPDINNGFAFTVQFYAGPVPIAPSPLGLFSVKEQIPAIGNVGIGIEPHWNLAAHPGIYIATVACDSIDTGPRLTSSFEVTSCQRRLSCTEA
jgi:hypothetical protein